MRLYTDNDYRYTDLPERYEKRYACNASLHGYEDMITDTPLLEVQEPISN